MSRLSSAGARSVSLGISKTQSLSTARSVSCTSCNCFTTSRPKAKFFLHHRRLDKINGGFSSNPKKCIIVNLWLKLQVVFNIFG